MFLLTECLGAHSITHLPFCAIPIPTPAQLCNMPRQWTHPTKRATHFPWDNVVTLNPTPSPVFLGWGLQVPFPLTLTKFREFSIELSGPVLPPGTRVWRAQSKILISTVFLLYIHWDRTLLSQFIILQVTKRSSHQSYSYLNFYPKLGSLRELVKNPYAQS